MNSAFASGNVPHSAAVSSELVGGLARKFERELTGMVEEVGAEEFTPARFRRLLGNMASLLAGLGREASVGTVSIYGRTGDGPGKVDTRFLARMPESGMKSLVADVADQVRRVRRGRQFRVLRRRES